MSKTYPVCVVVEAGPGRILVGAPLKFPDSSLMAFGYIPSDEIRTEGLPMLTTHLPDNYENLPHFIVSAEFDDASALRTEVNGVVSELEIATNKPLTLQEVRNQLLSQAYHVNDIKNPEKKEY